jgi:flagellar FliJ protein
MPRRFTFNLQAVLDQREREERDRQLAVTALERERMGVEARLRELQAGIAGAKMEMRARLSGSPGVAGGGGGVNVPEVRMQAGASLHLVAQAQRVALELSGLYRRLELARGELLRAATARKAVELLKEKRLAEWKAAVDRADAAAVDEVATMAFVRKAVRG